MASPVLVTGGTGRLGRHVVTRLREAGREVRALSRHGGTSEPGIESVIADLKTGTGLDAALHGIDIIVHCAGSRAGDEEMALNLVRAASRAGVRHLVNISVVGADRVPVANALDRAMFGYFAAKLATERVVAESGVPWSTVRATQFYDLVLALAQQIAKLPLIPVPSRLRFQPIDTDEVAARLVEVALGPPSGLVPDMAGPKVYSLAELLQAYLKTTHVGRRMIPIWLPGKPARAIRAGAVIAPERAVGRRTWEEFLAGQVSAPAAAEERRAA